MVTFTVPVSSTQNTVTEAEKKQFRFSVPRRAVVFAGSRHLQLSETLCTDLLHAFSEHGFSFFVGDAAGVDRSFRKAIVGTLMQENPICQYS